MSLSDQCSCIVHDHSNASVTDLEEEARIETLDGSFTAMPLAQVDLPIAAATQEFH